MELEYEKELPKWHPIRNYQREARNILHILQEIDSIQNFADRILITNLVHQLSQIEIRFHRKENQLFPYLEKHGWLGPSQGMWSFHDQIRAMLKDIREQIQNFSNQDLQNNLNYVVNEIRRLITIEQHRLFPNALSMLSVQDWQEMSRGEHEIGFMHNTNAETLSENPDKNTNQVSDQQTSESSKVDVQVGTNMPDQTLSQSFKNIFIELSEGRMLSEQLRAMLQVIPFDLTFVDHQDKVCFYNRGEDRVFPRSPAVIGREVRFCHPPKSVDTVLKILESFKSGEKNDAEFWINFRERKIHIRYFAVRDSQQNYLGVIEVSQDITEIQKLSGEKRLLDWA